MSADGRAASVDTSGIPSISSTSTAEWRAQHERDGRVDLWLEDEFNAGSRLVVSLRGGLRHSPAHLLNRSRKCSHRGGYFPEGCCTRSKRCTCFLSAELHPERG